MNAAKSVAALIVGTGLIGVIAWKLPIFELMETFLVLVIMPVFVLAGVGLVSWGTYNTIAGMPKEFRGRVERHMAEIKAKLDEQADEYKREYESHVG